MSKPALAIIVTVVLSIMGVIADYFLKRATGFADPYKTWWFVIGLIIYSATAFGAVFVFQHVKLAIIGVVYSVSLVLFLTALGVLFFNETLKVQEALGIVMAVTSLAMLGRFLQ